MGLMDAIFLNEDEKHDKKIVAFVKNFVEESRQNASRVGSEGIWMANIAALLGYDGLVFNTTTRSFQPVNRASAYLKRNRLHVNKLLPTAQNRLARLCKSPPKYEVKPESNETEDKEAARLALQTMEVMWEKLGLNTKRAPLYMSVQQSGHAYLKVCWDPVLGDFMPDPETGEPDFQGDIRVDVVSAFEVFPDKHARSFDELTRLVHCKVRPLEYFRDTYAKGALVKSEDTWLMSAQYEERINSLNNRGSGGSMVSESKNSAIEMVYYERRTKKYPQGRMIVCANGVKLEDKPLPVGEIPFAKFDDTIIAGKYYPETPVTHARPIQEYRNEVQRRKAEFTRRLLAGKFTAPAGNGLKQESLTDESGEVLYYTPNPALPNGGKVEAMTMPSMPQWAYQETEQCDSDINEIFGISEVSKGTLPSASIPAIGMQLLTEQDDTRIGVMTMQHEQSWARVGMLVLKHVESFYKMPRKLKIAGKSAYTVREVSGDMLRGNTDVMVVPGSTLPGSKTLKRQEIINTYTQGLLGDPADPKVREKVLGMLEFGDVAEIWQDYAVDQAQIQKGIKQIEEEGVAPIPDKMDNHEFWIMELNRYRKGDKFATLAPEQQAALVDLLYAHLDLIIEIQGGPAPAPSEEELMAQEGFSPEDGGAPGDVQFPVDPATGEMAEELVPPGTA